jgi:hypothetical protein
MIKTPLVILLYALLSGCTGTFSDKTGVCLGLCVYSDKEVSTENAQVHKD